MAKVLLILDNVKYMTINRSQLVTFLGLLNLL